MLVHWRGAQDLGIRSEEQCRVLRDPRVHREGWLVSPCGYPRLLSQCTQRQAPQVPASWPLRPKSLSCTRTPELRAHLNPSGSHLKTFHQLYRQRPFQIRSRLQALVLRCFSPSPSLDTQIIADHWPPGSPLPALGLLMAGGVSVTWGTHDSSLETGFSSSERCPVNGGNRKELAVPWFLQSWWPAAVFPIAQSQ